MLHRRVFLAGGASLLLARPGLAQAGFPSRPIRLVVPYPAGGIGDIQARVIGEHMAHALGQPVVVEPRPGGGTVIGTAQVAKAPADGYTLLQIANSLVINAKLHAGKLPYDGLRAFEPVAAVTNSPQVLAVNAASPFASFHDWLAAARQKPETISYSTVGPATTQHIAGEMLQRQAGVRLIYTPFPGGVPAMNAVLARHVDTVLTNFSELRAFIEAGKLRPLAVTTARRLEALKDVPTVAESGFPGFEASAWFGFAAPAGTPRDVIAKLAQAATNAVADADVQKTLLAAGLDPYPMGPEQLATHLRNQFDKYAKVIDEAGIKV